MMKRFSIVIPVYNAEGSIGVCLNKIAKQTYEDFELVIVNDGSTDNSLKIIKEFATQHPTMSINVISQDNAGAGAARNTGINESKGEYIVFIDSDDYIDDDFLEQTDDIIKQNNADVVFIDIVREDKNGRIIRYERMSDYKHLAKERMIRWQLTGKMPWGGVRKIVKSTLVKDNNLRYATQIKVGEESIYSFRVLELAQIVAFQTTSFYHYVDNSNSLTSNDVVENSLSVFDFIYGYLRESGKADTYATTVRAIAVTTTAIASNVVFNSKGFFYGYGEVKYLLKKYKDEMRGEVDVDALDRRVKLLMPWLRCGLVIPIWAASKVQHFLKEKIKKEV